MAMKEETKERLAIWGIVGMIVFALVSCIMFGLAEDANHNLTINLKNVGDEPIPFTLYLDGEEVMTGTMQPNEMVTFVLKEAFWDWGEDKIFTCSVQLPNTIYEREVIDGQDQYFLFD